MKKAILFILLILAVISCDLEKAQKEYEKGQYIQSIETTLKYFDKNENRIKKVNSKVKDEIVSKFSKITEYYSDMASNFGNEEQKINANINLFKIYIMLEERNYTKGFTDFTSKYKGEDFYSKANKLILKKYRDYFDSGLYDKAAEELGNYDGFSQILSRMNKMKFSKYERIYESSLKTKADNLIKIAEKYEEMKEYRKAEKSYFQVSETYKNYEKNYRNSYDKYTENKNKADLIDAEKYYEMGKETLKENSQKEKYRKAYEYFKKSDSFVRGYKDAANLANLYCKQGFFRYKIVGDTKYRNVIEETLKDIGYRDDSNPELIIEYTERNYYVSDPVTYTEKLSEKTPSGIGNDMQILYKVNSFDKIITSVKEKMRTDYRIRIDGVQYKDSYSNYLIEENNSEKIRYKGQNVPLAYRDQNNGKELGKEEMQKLIDKKVKEDIIQRIKIMEKRLERI
ncbi:hypothetical protein [Pseudoleptotrichia goodfellowii]|uniref:Lipoprotein n=1 Tax=Pseudoleptotrichia goodfellowii TaxID=157692 RepID=A0A510JCD3_9FUSO|nr:hypothetical protein [Pseudoleptotrichia goodfellowii]BBM36864.1 hypothetical protein JCM16774_1810 [Pseudoleptotrichia goodfellowii]